MGSNNWTKAKMALGLSLKNSCLYLPRTSDDESSSSSAVAAATNESVNQLSSGRSSGSLSKSSSKKTCAICLTTMRSGLGHAIFTAECSHSFHFHCITSNVKHGNQICPVCRAKWKEIPFRSPASSDSSHGKARSRNRAINLPQDDAWTNVVRQQRPPRLDADQRVPSQSHPPEPNVFDDDELLPGNNECSTSTTDTVNSNSNSIIQVKTYPELSAVSRSTSHRNFNVLIHLKAPPAHVMQIRSSNQPGQPSAFQDSCIPIDLVTVLDVSGSMAGTKLALLKQAMSFVIQNLGSSNRLSIIAFSSTARRLFPLTRMTEAGRQQALQAINSLTANGGTDIAGALRKGVKVLADRKWKNPVGSIILLSDGQDTYTTAIGPGGERRSDYKSLLPSIYLNGTTDRQFPVHAFGFGADHDAALMHSISERSGGTFSFVETEQVIQDAFAQCIGGLLSVVVQDLRVGIECGHPNLQVGSIKAGSYGTSITNGARMGSIDVGSLYAEEERDFLVTLDIPLDDSDAETTLLKVECAYRDPMTKEMVNMESASEVRIQRCESITQPVASMEVDKQRNRLRAAEAMAEARAAAENGNLQGAVSILDRSLRVLTETVSSKAGDRFFIALCAELRQMKERMADRQVYESSGRAYVLSGLSSHSWQRATTRGDATDSSTLAYQTPSMVDMVTMSQTMPLGRPTDRNARPRSAPIQPEKR